MDDAGPASTPAGGRSPSAPPNPAEHVGTSAAGANFTRKRQSPSVQHNNMIGSGRRKLDPDSSVEFLAFTPATKRDTRSGQGSTTSGQLYPPAIAARSQDQASRLPTSMVTNPPRRTRSQSRNSHSPRTKLVALGSPSSDGKAKKQESLLPISDENEPKKVALAGKSHTGLARSASPSTSEKPLKGAPDSSSKVATSLGVHRGTTELELSLVRAEKEMESKNNFIEASRSIIENIHSMCTCTICLDLAWRPHVLTPCGHTFCARCLVGWFEKREPHESEPRASLTPAERLAFERRATQRRVKLCPHCRARVEARPAEVWMIKGFLDQLDSAVRSGHGRGGEDSTPSTRQDKGDDMPQGTDLWKHIFPEAGHNKLIHDVEDGVMRCGDCSSEVVRGICTNPDCALEYPEADDYTGSGGFSPYSDWDGQGNPFEIVSIRRGPTTTGRSTSLNGQGTGPHLREPMPIFRGDAATAVRRLAYGGTWRSYMSDALRRLGMSGVPMWNSGVEEAAQRYARAAASVSRGAHPQAFVRTLRPSAASSSTATAGQRAARSQPQALRPATAPRTVSANRAAGTRAPGVVRSVRFEAAPISPAASPSRASRVASFPLAAAAGPSNARPSLPVGPITLPITGGSNRRNRQRGTSAQYDNHRLAARLFEHGLDDIGSDDEDEEDDDFIDDEERADHEAFMVEDGEEDEDEDNAIGSNAARRLAERRRNRQANRANNIQVISLDDSDEGGSSDVEMVQPSRSAQESGRSSSGGHGAGSAAPSRSDALSGQEPARADQDGIHLTSAGRAAPSSTASESFDTARERDSANSTPIPGHPSSHSEQESSSGQAEDSDALSDVEEDEGFDLDQMRDDEQEAIFDEDNEDEPEEEDRE